MADIKELLLTFPMRVVSQEYGARPEYYSSISGGKLKHHEGIDLVPSTALYACYEGIVVSSKRNHDGHGAYGKHIKIQLNIPIGTVFNFEDGTQYQFLPGDTLIATYAHCSVVKVSFGQIVEQGRWIGTMGSTGNSTGIHLHFQLQLHDAENRGIATAGMDYINPKPFLFGGVPYQIVDIEESTSEPPPIMVPGLPITVDPIRIVPAARRARGYDFHHRKRFISNNASFLILKATEGEDWKDPKFAERVRLATILGIPTFGYLYFKSDDDQSPEDQADNYLEQLMTTDFEVYLDIVDFESIGNVFNGNEAEALHRIGIHLKEKRQRKPLLYTSPGEWNHIMSLPGNKEYSESVNWEEIFDLYVAFWSDVATDPRLPNGFTKWLFWQDKVIPIDDITPDPYDHDLCVSDEEGLYNYIGFDPQKDRLKLTPRITAVWGLRVRSGPGTEYNRVGGIAYSEKVPIIDIYEKSSRETWFKVMLSNGQYGWIAASYHGDIFAKLEKDE